MENINLENENEKETIIEVDVLEEKTKDKNLDKFLACLSYLGILALIPYYGVKDNKFVKYHAVYGMNLLVLWLLYYLIFGILRQIKVKKPCIYGLMICEVTPWYIKTLLILLFIFIMTFNIMGIINVLKKEERPIPLIDKIKIFK